MSGFRGTRARAVSWQGRGEDEEQTLGRGSGGVQGGRCWFSVGVHFSSWRVSTGGGGSRHSSLSRDVLIPSPRLLS